jgi:hypothetical protein
MKMANNSFHYKFIFIATSWDFLSWNRKTYGDGVIYWSGKKEDLVKLKGYIRGSCSQNLCKRLPYSIIKRNGLQLYHNYSSEAFPENWIEDVIPNDVEIMWIYSDLGELLWTVKQTM